MNILSIDASTHSTGWAIFNNSKLVKYNCISDNSNDLFKRIHTMVDNINIIIKENKITTVVMEEVRPEDVGPNLKTHKALMYLQGVLAMMIHDNYPKINIEYLYPSEWRKMCGIKTGRGIKRATLKEEDIDFVAHKFGIVNINDDIADAIGIGYAYAKVESSKMVEWG